MYSPYLHARRSELLALRALVRVGGDLSGLVPILEPVISRPNDLMLCLKECSKAELPLVVLTNPYKHHFKGEQSPAAIAFHSELAKALAAHQACLPGYRVDASTTAKEIRSFLRIYQERRVALVYDSPTLSPDEFNLLAGIDNVTYHIALRGRVSTSQLRALPREKLIVVGDGFTKLARNADYKGRELFTDGHKAVGRSVAAVGDYTVTGSGLDIGGGKPGAVAIHLTYKEPQSGSVWVEHFVSEETDRDIGDPASKFLEAARKVVRTVRRRSAEFGSNYALTEYARHVAGETFPGLGKNKEHQIYHHIRLMLDVTQGAL